MLVALFIFPKLSQADEGMWLLSLLAKYNIAEMQKMGLQLSAEDIYSINKTSLKDAIVSLDYGSCTAELVSAQGLLFTNHHCGYDEIQSHSSLEHDYLKYGFWAKTLQEELPNPGKSATFLVRMEDVTDKVLQGIDSSTSEIEREEIIDVNSSVIEAEVVKNNHYEAVVESFFEGNKFYLFVLETFNDVRLVGAPPESIGKFGHSTDNWMYPRHTGDFSIFRIYTAPDGSPAEYSAENVPLKPKMHLKISIDGQKEDDFAMVLGYPGTTNRYLSASAVQNIYDIENPIRVEVRTAKQEIMKKYMDADAAIKIQYSAKYAQSTNYWKYSIGQNKGIKSQKMILNKLNFEDSLLAQINSSEELKQKYGDLLNQINYYNANTRKAEMVFDYLDEAIFGGSDLIISAYDALELYADLVQKEHKDSVIKRKEILREASNEYFKDFDLETDKEIFVAMLKIYSSKLDKNLQADILVEIETKYENDIQKYANELYANSIFADKEKMEKFLKKPKAKALNDDMGFQLMISFLNNYQGVYYAMESTYSKVDSLNRVFVDVNMKLNPEKDFYPDANSTLRLSYGKVKSYEARDGVIYKYFTTLKGVIAKEDPNNSEFFVDEKLIQLYEDKDYGQYADKDGTMHLCFITDNDITGGNSGSPVLNGKGELVGLAFDGNWEAMSSDLEFIPELQRTIIVDIRYVLFVIDKFAGATNLIEELNLN